MGRSSGELVDGDGEVVHVDVVDEGDELRVFWRLAMEDECELLYMKKLFWASKSD